MTHRAIRPRAGVALRRLAAIFALAAAGLSAAHAAPTLLVDAATGEVLDQREATRPWFPASTTKLMTVYVALDAVAAGKITLDTPMIVSPRAARMAPSKMGFAPGSQVTLDNALKMLMVHSANDIAVTIAEGVSGSVEAFANDMNAVAAQIGMRESHFQNPNGLPDPRHVSSARDLAILARALLQRFPDHADLFGIGALRLGSRIYPTHNGLLGRYDGADGMKTGFTCAAGFNVVATATRGGRRLIAVVLGAPSATSRNVMAASLFDRGFSGRVARGGALPSLPASDAGPAPDQRDGVCRNRGQALAAYMAEIDDSPVPLRADLTQTFNLGPFFGGGFTTPASAGGLAPSAVAALPRPIFKPVDIYVGAPAGWTGRVAHADDYAGPAAPRTTAYAAKAAAAGAAPLADAPDALPMKRGRAGLLRKPKAMAARPAPAKPAAKVAHVRPATKPAPAVVHKPAAKPAGAKIAAKPKPVAAAKPQGAE